MGLKTEYSVDMIRIREEVDKKEFKAFMNQFRYEGDVKYNKKISGLGNCRHNWYIEVEGGNSYWVGFNLISLNGKADKNKDYLYLEYNPNKIKMDGKLKKIFYRFFRGRNFEVVSADIAVDLYNIDINTDVFIDKGAHKNFKEHQYSKNNRTYYIGNRVKVYDKAKEQGIEDKNWTRYEITIKPKTIISNMKEYIYQKAIPGIYIINNFEYDFNLTDTQWFILQALTNNAAPIHMLGRKMRKKIKSALEKQTKFKADRRKLSATLKKYIFEDLLIDV